MLEVVSLGHVLVAKVHVETFSFGSFFDELIIQSCYVCFILWPQSIMGPAVDMLNQRDVDQIFELYHAAG